MQNCNHHRVDIQGHIIDKLEEAQADLRELVREVPTTADQRKRFESVANRINYATITAQKAEELIRMLSNQPAGPS